MRRGIASFAASLLLVAVIPAVAAGQARCGVPADRPPPSTTVAWSPPLDRPVTIQVRDVSLRTALDRIAAIAGVRLSYSAEALPLDRRVCLAHSEAPLGQLLRDLLGDLGVAAVAAGGDHLVLAPIGLADAREELPVRREQVIPLERIVVTGSPTGGPDRALPYAMTVLRPSALARASPILPLARAVGASVPGVWAWEQSPASLTARYGSIRGASSFGVSYPKIFIDGVEVANPLLLTHLNPEAIERVEVIRGPQGAALYGTDAISGVVNIVSRHQGADALRPRLLLRSGIGGSGSDFAPGAAIAHDHVLTLRAGSSTESLGLSLGAGTAQAVLPNAFSRYLTANGSGRLVGPATIVTGTLRFDARRAGVPANPLLAGALASAGGPVRSPLDESDSPGTQSAVQYTLGSNVVYTPGERWTHSVVVGIDGSRLDRAPEDHLPIPHRAEDIDRWGEGSAERGTLRASTSGRFGETAGTAATLNLAFEQSLLHEIAPATPRAGAGGATPEQVVSWLLTTAGVAQVTGSVRDRLFLTGGLRLERNEGLATGSQLATLPVLGAAWVLERNGAGAKLRAAYGRGIRPVETPSRDTSWGSSRLLRQGLEPEEQVGVEAGIDLFFGRALSLQVTAYDQLATGLIQRVALPHAPGPPPGADPRRVQYAAQNVGEISNRGWEIQGTLEEGRLSVDAALALTRSVVRGVSDGYTGDLRAGDRMLEVPARTASLTASWAGDRWAGSLSAARAWDWINYDRLALAADYARAQRMPDGAAGDWLRSYWREYPGNTRLSATLGADVRPGLRLILTGENLLDRQRGEPDNLTILPGRSLVVGARLGF